MAANPQFHLIYGPDTYQSYKTLQAIKLRFSKKQTDSFADLVTYDMEDTPLDTLRQALLTMPFFVTHRLFILKHTFNAPKATLQGIVDLLPTIGKTTVVVFYESKACDQRLGLFQWLKKNATMHEFPLLQGRELLQRIEELAKESKVQIDPEAARRLALYFPDATWQLALEVQKLGQYALARNNGTITKEAVALLCVSQSEESLFRLTDSIRDEKLASTVAVYRTLVEQEDPMLLAGTIGAAVRTVAKIALCLDRGISRSDAIAQSTKLNPYVIKLTLDLARRQTVQSLRASYRALIQFDRDVKEGRLPSDIGLLLLIIRLHGTLRTR